MLLIAVLSLAALSFVMFHTRIGLAIRCCSFDIKAAKLMGINPDVVIGATFTFAGLLGGIGGVLLGAKYAVYPEIGDMVYRAFFACMVGGLGTMTGAIFGGAAYRHVGDAFQRLHQRLHQPCHHFQPAGGPPAPETSGHRRTPCRREAVVGGAG